MTAGIRCGALLALLVSSVACDDSHRVTLPTPTPTEPQSAPAPAQPSPGQPAPPGGQPPLAGPSTTYLFSGPLSYAVRDYTLRSRYVLYDNGAFALHYDGILRPYLGAYRRDESGRIYLDFGADGAATGDSDAWGTLNDDLLEVRYNLLMELSDFENAVYRRSQ